MENTHWQGKKVLITGPDGFVGSHLTEALLKLGAKVSVYVKEKTSDGPIQCQLGKIAHLVDEFEEIITGDIADKDAINLINRNGPEVIFHLAAKAYVPFSFDHPFEVMETNLIGTLNILEAARLNKNIKRVVCTSSSEAYGTAQYVPIDEKHPLNPTSPYAASKVAADRYSFAYWNTYGVPVSIIRPFNMFGPRHTYDMVPKFINLALEGKPITVYGNGEQSRDLLYVDDAVEGFLIMGSHPDAVGKAVNFATGKDYSVNYCAQKIKELTNSASEIVHVEERAAEVDRLCGDYSYAKQLFGWEPKVSFEEGLKRNIEFVKNQKTSK